MTTIHDVPTMRYAIPRVVPSAEQSAAVDPNSFLKALALVVVAVGVIGAAIVAAAAFLLFPPPAHTTVVRPDTHPVAVAHVATPAKTP